LRDVVSAATGLGNRPGLIAYDHRTLTTSDGRRVQDFTLRLRLVAADAEAEAARAQIERDVKAAHDALLNRGFLLGADQVHFELRFAGAGEAAHDTVLLTSERTDKATQNRWSVHNLLRTMLHEILHYYGLHDENAAKGAEKGVFRQDGRGHQVFTDDSIMGSSPEDRDVPGRHVYQRHIDQIGRIAQDTSVTVTPGTEAEPAEVEATAPVEVQQVPVPPEVSAPSQLPLVPAPLGTQWQGRLLLIGDVADWQRDKWISIAERMNRPVIVVWSNASGAIDTVDTVLQRFARLDVNPILVATLHVREADFTRLHQTYRPVGMRLTTVPPMKEAWRLISPDDSWSEMQENLEPAMFKRADTLQAVPTGHSLPRPLAQWLSLNTWDERVQFLRDHRHELMNPDTAAQLEALPGDEGRPYRLIQRLAQRNEDFVDGPTSVAPAPATSPDVVAPFELAGPLSERFLAGYLAPQPTPMARKSWNDALLQVVDVRSPAEIATSPGGHPIGLSPDEMVELVESLEEADGHIYVNILGALRDTLNLPDEVVDLPGPDFATHPDWTELLRKMAACKPGPVHRHILIHQFRTVEARTRAAGRPGHADLVRVVANTFSNCT
jgi:hypothetical protein